MIINRRHISIALLSLAIIGGFGHVAHAIEITDILGLGGIQSVFTEIVAQAVNMALMMMSWILAIAGLMLNVAMNITLNIKAFVDATPAIFTVWRSIRDISGMFIIFMLLFAGIRMILAPINVPAANMGQLIKTIVVAGILINFSFFIAGLGIDVSNIVSMQLYNTIAPAQKLDSTSMLSVEGIKSAFKQGGISNIFMSSLKISSLYDPKTLSLTDVGKNVAANSTTGFSPSLKIIIIGVIAFMIMLSAAISFALAALAFTVRFVILLFLLAFSPIWFASFALPQLDEYAKKWTKIYKGQMLFMPVYLLLMYFAMSVLVSNNMVSGGFASNLSNRDDWYSNILILSVNAVLVIFMLNAPLLAAMSIMSSTPKWAEGLGAGALWKKVGGLTGGYAGRKTLGWAGAKTDGYLANTRIGNSLVGRDLRAATTGALAKNKFGGSRSFEETKKEQKGADSKRREIDRTKEFFNVLRMVKSNQPLPEGSRAIKDILGSMSEKERLSLGKDALMDEKVIRHLKKQDFDAIKKSEDISLDDQQAIAKQRKEIFKNAITYAHASNDPESSALVKDMVKNYEVSDIAGLDESLLTNPKLIEHLSSEHLKKIADSEASADMKDEIARTILNWKNAEHGDKQHRAFGWINKNKNEWLKDAPSTAPETNRRTMMAAVTQNRNNPT